MSSSVLSSPVSWVSVVCFRRGNGDTNTFFLLIFVVEEDEEDEDAIFTTFLLLIIVINDLNIITINLIFKIIGLWLSIVNHSWFFYFKKVNIDVNFAKIVRGRENKSLNDLNFYTKKS